MNGLWTTSCSFLGWLQRLGLKSWHILKQHYLFVAPWIESAVAIWSRTIPVASGHNMISNRDAFYDRTTDYVLFLLWLATAPGAESVTHFSTIPVAACHNMIWIRDASYDRTTCCFFLGWLQRLGPWAEIVARLEAVPFLLFLATTWFEILMHFMTGLRAVCSFLRFLGWHILKQQYSCCS